MAMSINEILEGYAHNYRITGYEKHRCLSLIQAKLALQEILREAVKDKGYDYWLSTITHDDEELAEIQARAMEIAERQANTEWRKKIGEVLK